MIQRFHVCDQAFERNGEIEACLLTDKELQALLTKTEGRCQVHGQLVGLGPPVWGESPEDARRRALK